VPTQPGQWRVASRVINETAEPGRAQHDFVDANLYAVGLSVRLPAGVHRDTIFQELPASFRYDRSMAGVGINSHVEHENDSAEIRLWAETVPVVETPRLEARDIPGADPTFAALSGDPDPVLESIADAMAEYDTTRWTEKIASLAGIERSEAESARERYRREIARFRRGQELLRDKTYPAVREAFLLMNEAMGLANPQHERWRLFQIVFIVSCLRELAAREHAVLAESDDGWVDLLWFAAGGGKTEAFMGTILWQAFFDRLRGKTIGTTAFLRYPLRLLTFQQLQRLARALAAAEVIRKRHGLPSSRFSLGYLVGNTVTPNRIVPERHKRYEKEGVDPRFQRMFRCPFCDAPVALKYDASLWLIEHRCTNPSCPGGQQRLPIYITDQDVYRFLPTVIVSTVDKLALLGQNQRFANIFGRIDLVCHRHGASFSRTNDLCEAASAFAKGDHPDKCGGVPVLYGPFHDVAPAILVQDELHLLSEELGTFDAHYETGTMALCRSLAAKPWKIVGATATIQEFERQAGELYLRHAREFPVAGSGAYDSFYYCQNPDRIGRLFIGLLGVARKHTPAVTKTLSILYKEVQAARELLAADPAVATSAYGTGILSQIEAQELCFLYELVLTYVLTRKGSDQVAEAIESRVRRELQELCPSHGELLIEMFNGGVDVSQMIASMEELKTASPSGDPTTRVRGIVTTNIIGHGVDVDRFNVIVFAGLTRLVAEYIQASGRVGRRYPGISVFVATPQGERDRSIFGRFGKFHQYLDRLVDPAAVTRWPEPALDRTLPGLMCGYIMGVAAAAIRRPLPTVEAVLAAYGGVGTEALSEDAIIRWMIDAYGSDYAPSPNKYADRLRRKVLNKFSSIVNAIPRRGGAQPLNTHLDAMTSLRDVDEPAQIRVANSDEAKRLRRLING
jgi:hypothetical protein